MDLPKNDAMDVDEAKAKGEKHEREEGAGEEERPWKRLRVEEERVTADIQKVETKIGNIEGDIATKEKERAGLGEKTSKYKSLDRQIGALQAEKTQLHINKSKLQENKNKLLEMQSKLMDVKQSPPSPVDPRVVLEEIIRTLPKQRQKLREYPFLFLGRENEFRQVYEVVSSNFALRNAEQKSSHTFVFVPGGPGIGKTRFAHELPTLLRNFHSDESPPELVAALQNPVYILVDFNIGLQYLPLLDSVYHPTVCMGVRLLRAFFGGNLDLGMMCSNIGAHIKDISTPDVLSAIIAEERMSRGPDAPLCIFIHIDEYQLYIARTQEEEKVSLAAARYRYKDLLKQIGGFMLHDGMLKWDRNTFIVPVCSGISEIDTTFLPTEYGKDVVRLPPLSRDDAMSMANEKYSADPGWPAIKTSDFFQVALSDTGYIPRYIEYLLVPEHCHCTNWGDQLYLRVSNAYGQLIVARSTQMEHVALLALAAETVTGDLLVTKDETLSELERTELLFLSKESGFEQGYFMVQMPFVQLKLINYALAKKKKRTLFPNELLFFPAFTRAWRWADFELMLPHFHSTLCRAFSEQLGSLFDDQFPLKNILRGCRGPQAFLNLKVSLTDFGVFYEDHQFLTTVDAVAEVVESIDCNGEAVDIFSGIFICRAGNALVDYRTYHRSATKNRKPVALFFQAKHSEVHVVGSSITWEWLTMWHQRCSASLAEVAKKFHVGIVLVTNRNVAFPEGEVWPDNLLVISRDQLAVYLGPLAQRGLLANPQ